MERFLRCELCGKAFEMEDGLDTFEAVDDMEAELWGHIEFEHPDVHEEWQNWDTPEMIEELYRFYRQTDLWADAERRAYIERRFEEFKGKHGWKELAAEDAVECFVRFVGKDC